MNETFSLLSMSLFHSDPFRFSLSSSRHSLSLSLSSRHSLSLPLNEMNGYNCYPMFVLVIEWTLQLEWEEERNKTDRREKKVREMKKKERRKKKETCSVTWFGMRCDICRHDTHWYFFLFLSHFLSFPSFSSLLISLSSFSESISVIECKMKQM